MTFSLHATIVISILSAVASGLILFVLKDYIASFKFKKEDFLMIKDFNEHRVQCCAVNLKKEFNDCKNKSTQSRATVENDVANIKVGIKDFHIETEKQFDRGREDFALLRKDISNLDKTVAAMGATLIGIEKQLSERS